MNKAALLLASFAFLFRAESSQLDLVTDSSSLYDVLKSKGEPSAFAEATYQYILNNVEVRLNFGYESNDRIERSLLQKERAVCVPFRVENSERVNRYLFTLPTDFYVAHRLYQRATDRPIENQFLSDSGALISLSDYFKKNPHSILLLMSNQSFGPFLDEQISRVNSSQKYLRIGAEPYTAYLEMFEKKRGDFAILLPAIVDTMTQDRVKLRSYFIEGSPHFINGHIMCNQHPLSYQFIEDVNKLLLAMYNDGRYQKLLNKYSVVSQDHDLKAHINNFLGSKEIH